METRRQNEVAKAHKGRNRKTETGPDRKVERERESRQHQTEKETRKSR